ncbi:MAG: murein biosynthesis integral membrane protein MurJ [Alphaproteobacteria bacterium]
MKFVKAMTTVAGMTAISRIAGFARDTLTAIILGAGPVADAFFIALKLPNFFRRVTAEGAFSVSFVPLYSGELETAGREQADLFAHRAFAVLLWGLTCFTLLAMIFMPCVIDIIAPGFEDDGQSYELAVNFARVTFPYLLLMSLTSLLGGVLAAHDRFAAFAVAPLLFNLAMIAALLVADLFPTAGHALSWGVVVAGILQFILLTIAARRGIGFRVKIVRPEMTPNIKRLFKLMGPGIIGAGIVQINLFTDMIIASTLATGSISYLYYADRLNQLPLSTVGIAVGTALLPMLSRSLTSKNAGESQYLFNRALEVTLILGVPAAIALYVLAGPIISVLFEHGKFTAEDARITARVLQGYAIGLPAYIAVKVFSTGFWARQDTMTPVKITLVITLANIALALTLIQFMGVAGIAMATGIVGWGQIGLLWWKLRDQDFAKPDARARMVTPRLILCAVIMGAVVYGLSAPLAPMLHDESLLKKVVALGILISAGLGVYGTGIVLTGALRISDFKNYFKRSRV